MATLTKYHLSRRILETETPIMQVMKGMKRTGNTIDLSQGIPFFGPPEEAISSTLSSLKDVNRYGPDQGDMKLTRALIEKLSKKNNMGFIGERSIMITAGANIAFLNALAAITDPGDNVILLDPYYFNHGMTLDVLGVEHRHISYIEDIDSLMSSMEMKLDKRTRALVIVSPNNPTGGVIPENIVRGLADICKENGLWLISDETYEDFHYVEEHFSPASISQEMPVISLFSFSKSFGISGWRVGYMTFPEVLFDSLLKVQDTTVICPSRIGQELAYNCIRNHPDHTRKFIEELNNNRLDIIKWLDGYKDLIVSKAPTGAFYFFLQVNEAGSSMDLASRILEEVDVLLVPGGPFGKDTPPHLRIAYGNATREKVRTALDRLDDVFTSH
jgi:aspartate/methionine/tyrosine aminotransferase